MRASSASGSDNGGLNGSLGRQLVLATLVFGIVFTGAAVAVRTWSAWQANLAAMTAELTLIDQVFQRTLSKAIWEMDRDALQTHVNGVAQVSPVGRVELRLLQNGRTTELMAQRREGAQPSQRAPVLHRQLNYEPYPGASEVVGELTLEGDERVLWERLRGELAGIVLTQLIQSLLLAGLVMWVFNRTVTVHVRRMARHLGALTPQTLDHRLRLERAPGRRDELSLLESGVNQLQGNLSDYLERQRRDERDLAAHRDRLAELVDEQTAELRAANAQLEELSRSDPLTGLANRRHFDEVKDVEFRRAQRLNQPLSVLLCDVDFFKRYNDTYGHALGDDCLRLIAQTLRETFGRAGELAARIGGEEFAVLLPAVDAEQAHAAAERLREALAGRDIPHSASQVAPRVTLSIGVAQFDPETMDRFDALLHRADQALYRAKRQGRDRVAA
ncbi:diguanylate cyclase domain-containing protein [Rhizobacter sp. OV335]|uniref:diguanylate cyclase domain-containing protein n=1 Tax=Rhizobacter sp. OV335 TaxID=1500264 RepID=UPI00091212CD|nr:diguanylate cyclase [Rhizobacter sp. OV335]SHN34226.1 diguanylate cyclase (GGDEF) domain-containing protein [Rhizobacter sp. OV335]